MNTREVCRTNCTGRIAVPELPAEPAVHPSSLQPACHPQCTSQIPPVMGVLGIFSNFVSIQQPGSWLVASAFEGYCCRVAADWIQHLLSSNSSLISLVPGVAKHGACKFLKATVWVIGQIPFHTELLEHFLKLCT